MNRLSAHKRVVPVEVLLLFRHLRPSHEAVPAGTICCRMPLMKRRSRVVLTENYQLSEVASQELTCSQHFPLNGSSNLL